MDSCLDVLFSTKFVDFHCNLKCSVIPLFKCQGSDTSIVGNSDLKCGRSATKRPCWKGFGVGRIAFSPRYGTWFPHLSDISRSRPKPQSRPKPHFKSLVGKKKSRSNIEKKKSTSPLPSRHQIAKGTILKLREDSSSSSFSSKPPDLSHYLVEPSRPPSKRDKSQSEETHLQCTRTWHTYFFLLQTHRAPTWSAKTSFKSALQGNLGSFCILIISTYSHRIAYQGCSKI